MQSPQFYCLSVSNFYYMNFAGFTFPAELRLQHFGHMIIRLPRALKISNEDTRSMYCSKFKKLKKTSFLSSPSTSVYDIMVEL